MEMATIAPVDQTTASRCICDPDNKLALIPGHPDKDEYGHFIVDGFDPIASALDGAGSGKRRRVQRNLGDGDGDGGAGGSTAPKPKAKPKLKARPKPKAKPKAKAKKQVKGGLSEQVSASVIT